MFCLSARLEISCEFKQRVFSALVFTFVKILSAELEISATALEGPWFQTTPAGLINTPAVT